MGEVIDITQDWGTVMYELAKKRLPQEIQQGREKATFKELSQAVTVFCETYCAITDEGALKCPEWSEGCPLYSYRMGAIEAK